MNKRRSSQNLLLTVVMVLLGFPASAVAHSANGVAGYFVGGMLHPLMTPTHVLVLLALGLLAGQHSPLNLKTPLVVFIPVSALALLLTTTGIVKAVYPPILIGIALVAGVLIALEKSPPAIVTRMIFAIAAVAIGLDSAMETGSWTVIAKTLLGTWTGIILVAGNTAYYVSLFTKKQWQKTGIRVAGSWITAASLMILAFALRH